MPVPTRKQVFKSIPQRLRLIPASNNDMHRSARSPIHVVAGEAVRAPGDVCSLDSLTVQM